MKVNIQKPRNFINPLLSRKAVDAEKFNAFKLALEHYKKSLADQISTKQTEPNIVTNTLKPFLDSFGFVSEAYSQKGQISIDLAVMQNSKPLVIIEAKMPNSADMILAHDLHKKSFCQAIMYFMNERAKNNTSLFHIIIADFNNWFIFDAKDFDRHFWRNATIKKLYDAYTSKSLLGDTTGEFYLALERELPKLKKDLLDPEEIECAHFNVQLPTNDKELTAIYKLLSADCLLKEFNPNDANSLNREFYTELLYILGLEESKDGGKKIIGKAKNPQNGTLYENISNKLAQYNKSNDFEAVIKLIIIWVNRILFLKLLESQIVKWTGNKDHKFLNANTLDQYDQLETLFFEVLAKPIDKRSIHHFDHIPYLNSSLFEIHPDENNGIKISNLVDGIEIGYYAKTVVKNANNQRKTGKVSTLSYLLAFLDAFDFANDSDEELVKESKSLISASVLGLIFEKINGYKDGSFYTPSFVTMYMARETITKTVIDKFNAGYGWQCKTLTDLHNKNLDITEANTLINSIKICDPAVGSGHFLVSALNEMLRIKSELGVLVSDDGKRIKDYSLSIENDDLIIKSAEGEIFEYKKGNIEKTRIQKTMFKEKQLLIENCLFGVDINPNSVNICRLRLWIELLKNAYYKDDGQLDTLPNIDINIKCGNSLISRFGLADDLDSKTIKAEIQDYKQKVAQYKENIGSKRDVLQSIDLMKAKFQEKLKSGHSATKALNVKLTEYVKQFSFDGLSKELEMIAFVKLGLRGKQAEMFAVATNIKAKAKKLQEVETALQNKTEVENGKIYENAFEWRFEFPEVLNEVGEFVGFDVVIGNPPYGVSIKGQERDYLILNLSKVPDHEIYYWFIDKGHQILKPKGIISFITPNTILFNVFAQNYRLGLFDKWTLNEILDCTNFDIFEDATVRNIILQFIKDSSKQNILGYKNTSEIESFEELVSREQIKISKETAETNIKNWGLAFKLNDKILSVIKKIKTSNLLGKNYDTTQGYIPYRKSDLIKLYGEEKSKSILKNREWHSNEKLNKDYKEEIWGESISKYGYKRTNSFVWYGKHLATYVDPKFFNQKRILIREITSPFIIACLIEEEFVNDPQIINIIQKKSDFTLEYLWAILNSKLATFYHFNSSPKATKGAFPKILVYDVNNFPLPEDPNKEIVNKINSLAKEMLVSAKESQMEHDMDVMIYALYGLNEEEINLINKA